MSILFSSYNGANFLDDTSLSPTTAWGNRTMAAWVYVTSLTNLNECVECGSANGAFMFIGGGSANSTTSGNISFRLTNATGSANSDIFATCSQNAWHHCAITWDGTTQRTYVDGVATGTATPSYTSTGNWSYTEVGPMAGTVDNAVFYAAALTAEEIKSLYATRLPKRRANLIAHYPLFANGASVRVLDYSGNGNNLTEHGTIANGDLHAPAPWGAAPHWAFIQSGGPIDLGAGAAAATSAATGAVSVAQALSNTSANTSSATASMSVARALSGTAAVTTAASGTLFIAGAGGTAAVTTAATAAMSVAQALSGTAAATSAASGTLFIAGAGGTAAAASSSIAAMSVAQALAGTAATTTSATGTLFIAGAAGTAAVTTAATAAMSVARALSGTAAATSSSTGAMSVAQAEAGTAANTTSATASIVVAQGLAGTAAATSAATGSIVVAQALVSTSQATTSATAAMLVDRQVSGASSSATAADGGMSVARALSGSAGVGTAATAAMSVATALSGSAASTTAADGGFNPGGFFSIVTNTTSATAAMTVAQAVSGTASATTTATATMTVVYGLAATPTVTTSASATIQITQAMSSTSVTSTTANAGVLVSRAVAGDALVGTSATGFMTIGVAQLAGVGATGTSANAVMLLKQAPADRGVLSMVRRVAKARIAGDTRPIAVNVTASTGRPVDLGGATATVKILDASDMATIVVSERECVISGSQIRYTPSTWEVSAAGSFLARFNVTLSDGELMIGHLMIDIAPDL